MKSRSGTRRFSNVSAQFRKAVLTCSRYSVTDRLTREQPSALDKHSLIESVLEQSAVIAQRHERLGQLQARIRALEARLSQNRKDSSKPPRQDPPFPPKTKPPQSRRKSGGQPGHKGQGLCKVQTPDRSETPRH
jgi:transposase